ncbi:MAG: NAD(P)-dependent oxidoreductase [Bacteriovoracaceae bacterium]|nr:NAD(P)-dependent oxidoreductase [Bacteriovoracaceae bacterium]
MQKNEKNPGYRKLLLTGGTGFLGSHIAKKFLTIGYDVTILKRSTSNLNKLEEICDKVLLIDVEDFKGGNFDVFIHAATSYGRNKESSEIIAATNIDFPLSILEKINSNELHFLNIGTSLPADLNIYAKTKHDFTERVKVEFPSMKFTNVLLEQFYGPHDGTFITYLVTELNNKVEKIELTEGKQKRDFIFYEDVLSALELLVKRSELGEFALGTGESHTIREICETVYKYHSNDITKMEFGKIPYRDNEVMNSVANIGKLSKLGWKPVYNLDSGIEHTLERW